MENDMDFRTLVEAILFNITGGRIMTARVRNYLTALRAERRRESENLQKQLDLEHTRGWGISARDGRKVVYEPFNAAGPLIGETPVHGEMWI